MAPEGCATCALHPPTLPCVPVCHMIADFLVLTATGSRKKALSIVNELTEIEISWRMGGVSEESIGFCPPRERIGCSVGRLGDAMAARGAKHYSTSLVPAMPSAHGALDRAIESTGGKTRTEAHMSPNNASASFLSQLLCIMRAELCILAGDGLKSYVDLSAIKIPKLTVTPSFDSATHGDANYIDSTAAPPGSAYYFALPDKYTVRFLHTYLTYVRALWNQAAGFSVAALRQFSEVLHGAHGVRAARLVLRAAHEKKRQGFLEAAGAYLQRLLALPYPHDRVGTLVELLHLAILKKDMCVAQRLLEQLQQVRVPVLRVLLERLAGFLEYLSVSTGGEPSVACEWQGSNDPYLLFLGARWASETGRCLREPASAMIGRILKVYPTPRGFLTHGNCLWREGRASAASNSYQCGLRLAYFDPRCSDALRCNMQALCKGDISCCVELIPDPAPLGFYSLSEVLGGPPFRLGTEMSSVYFPLGVCNINKL